MRKVRRSLLPAWTVTLTLLYVSPVLGFTPPSSRRFTTRLFDCSSTTRSTSPCLFLHHRQTHDDNGDDTTSLTTTRTHSCHSESSTTGDTDSLKKPRFFQEPQKIGATLMLAATLFTLSTPAVLVADAADYSDYNDASSDAVTAAIARLQESAGKVEDSFKAYESVADIITEGKGVGGSLSYTGVKLERGYVADEDTTIYNPGLTLLTESEKDRLVEAVIQNRKVGLSSSSSSNAWSENNEFAFDFLKTKLDPLHMFELKGYLRILPFYGAFVYLVALAVQQVARDLFPVAYLASAFLVFGPIAALIVRGPQ